MTAAAVGGVANPRPVRGSQSWWDDRVKECAVNNLLSWTNSLHPEPWMERAACASSADPEAFFPDAGRPGHRTRLALRICAGCEVAEECLTFALRDPDLRGVWGGTTERQRRAAIRRNRKANT